MRAVIVGRGGFLHGSKELPQRSRGERAPRDALNSLGSQCVVSPGSGGASSSSATFFKSSPNDRSTSALTLLRKSTRAYAAEVQHCKLGHYPIAGHSALRESAFEAACWNTLNQQLAQCVQC
jgi:hypothetical protein